MIKNDDLVNNLQRELASAIETVQIAFDEVTISCKALHLKALMLTLRDVPCFAFDQLIDLCAVDYLLYGIYDWETEAATEQGFSRAVGTQPVPIEAAPQPSRYAVVYHLLSTKLNHRLRVVLPVEESHLMVPSVHSLWKVANWFEREAYDLYGILFEGHPDLRRILTDYGFIGHPFRKDFPLGGQVEMRYDATLEKVIYEPVDLVPRIGVPKVIREDNRYADLQGESS